ncbi:UNVERIFIED_CONTAM: hypothetical protein K2H54_059490 [Gekko kuhli]
MTSLLSWGGALSGQVALEKWQSRSNVPGQLVRLSSQAGSTVFYEKYNHKHILVRQIISLQRQIPIPHRSCSHVVFKQNLPVHVGNTQSSFHFGKIHPRFTECPDTLVEEESSDYIPTSFSK